MVAGGAVDPVGKIDDVELIDLRSGGDIMQAPIVESTIYIDTYVV